MRRVFTWYLVAAIGVAALEFFLASNNRLASVPLSFAAFVAMGAVIHGIRTYRPERSRFWLWVAAALGAGGVATAIFPIAGVYWSTASFRLADLLYIPAYLAVSGAALSLVRQLGPLRVAGLEAAIGALALGSFLWPLVVEPNAVEIGGLNGVLTAIYPLCDVLLVLLVLRILLARPRLPAAHLLTGASLCLVSADVTYFSPIFANGELAGRFISVAYVVAYMLFGAGALHPSMRRLLVRSPSAEEAAPRRLLVLLACATLSMPAAILFNRAVEGRVDVEQLMIIGAAMIALVLIRIWQLLEHSDALRRRAEASEQRFRMVFDSAGHGISIGADGMMTETNAALREMLGYTGDELSQKHYTETTHPDDRNLALKASDEVMSGQRPAHTFEKRLVHKDGTVVWVAVTLTRAQDGTFGISLIDDITVPKALEAELRQAQKMEAVGKLAGGIAHDFNNLMTAVAGCTDILLDELADDDPRRERVEIIASSAERAADLTRQLLAFSRRQVLRLEPVDVACVVNGLEPILRRLLPSNVSITCEVERGAVARVDKPQLEQVLMNLALNAGDALPRGGHMRIAVRAAGDSAELCVTDNGVGMDESTRARVFEPFFTTKRSGTGLGLSTVDGIVAQSGGTISVDSSLGHGTTFTIRLPLVDEPAAAVEPPVAKPPTVAVGRVLLAEDEELVRKVVAEMLRRSGYEVTTAASGEEALALIAEGIELDILVTDVAMTGMDGKTLSSRAHGYIPSLPVLFVSGYPAEVLSGDEMIAEGDEVLTKPFTPAELVERVEFVRGRVRTLAA
jgi:two-component system cell cycle sensor histidine kinase/response regulator CckA